MAPGKGHGALCLSVSFLTAMACWLGLGFSRMGPGGKFLVVREPIAIGIQSPEGSYIFVPSRKADLFIVAAKGVSFATPIRIYMACGTAKVPPLVRCLCNAEWSGQDMGNWCPREAGGNEKGQCANDASSVECRHLHHGPFFAGRCPNRWVPIRSP